MLFKQGLIFFLIIQFSTCDGFPTVKISENICRTLECNQTASRVLNYMDATINPCDNFYKFACGNFIKNTNIYDDKNEVSAITVLKDKVLEQLTTIVQKLPSNLPKRLQLVKTFYDICMNESAIEENGLNPLKDKFNKLGGWPVLEGSEWKEDDFSWTKAIYTLRELGYSFDYLFSIDITVDLKNNSIPVIEVNKPRLELDPQLLINGLENKIVKGYKKYMVDVAVLLGAERDYAEKELTKSFLFERALGNISSITDVLTPENYNPITVSKLEEKYPSIPWLEYLNKIFQPRKNIEKNQKIFVSASNFLLEFEKLMNKTPKRIQANYILWRVFLESVSYLSDDIRQPEIKFSTLKNGRAKEPLRLKGCFDDISNYMGLSIGALYVKNYFNENSKENIIEMVNNIKNQLKKTIQMLDWMDEKTKIHALEKVNSVINRMGYDDMLLDDHKIDEFYKNFELDEHNSSLDTLLTMKLIRYNLTSELLKESVQMNNKRQLYTPTDVNAFYFHQDNAIQIPAAFLQGRYFNVDRPQYMNYGAIGYVIGHEITHGFDISGMDFDKDGNLHNWWKPSTKIKFLKKVSCLITQYSNYTVRETGKNINGEYTILENIADNGGIKLAYLAYNYWSSLNKQEPLLPGLEHFSSNQMFWISAAQALCSVERPEFSKILLNVDNHSSSEFRVIGSFQNMKEFSDVFKCALESPMNPRKKCSIW